MSLLTRHLSRFNLPPGWSLTTIEPNPSPPLPDLCAAVESALAQPLSSPRLIDLASPAARVCIVFTDATRACPDHILVPAILRELDRAGVPDDHLVMRYGAASLEHARGEDRQAGARSSGALSGDRSRSLCCCRSEARSAEESRPDNAC